MNRRMCLNDMMKLYSDYLTPLMRLFNGNLCLCPVPIEMGVSEQMKTEDALSMTNCIRNDKKRLI